MISSPGLLRRLSALFYDTLLLTAILFVGTAALLPFRGGEAIAAGDPLYGAYLLSLGFGYFAWCWTHGGQTLGMRAWHIRLVRDSGGPLSWRVAAIRFAAALCSCCLLGIGFWWALWDRESRCWHDRVAGTRLAWDAAKAGMAA